MDRISASGPCITHGNLGHAKCMTHECCIGHNGRECRNPVGFDSVTQAHQENCAWRLAKEFMEEYDDMDRPAN